MNLDAQRTQALEKANRVRLQNSRLKKDLRDAPPTQSRRMAAFIIEATQEPDPSARIPVVTLLRSINRAGDSRAYRWLGTARIAQSRRLGNLSLRQREALAALLIEDAQNLEVKQKRKAGK